MARGAAALLLALHAWAGAREAALTAADYDAFVKGQRLTLILFYTPTDQGSRLLAPAFRAAAEECAEDGVDAAFAAMDYSEGSNHALGADRADMYALRGVPTMVAVHGAAPAYPIGETLLPSQGLNGAAKDSLGNSFEPYYGGPEAHEICWWMTQLTLGNNPIEEERKQRIGLYEDDAENYGFVTELDDDRLNAITSSSTDPRFWLLDIYSDRCPRCQSLAPQMIAIGKHFKKTLVSAGSFGKKGSVGARVKVAALNTRVWYNATEELTGPVLPWLALFHKGYKIAEMPGEDIQGVVSWVETEVRRALLPPKRKEKLRPDVDYEDEYDYDDLWGKDRVKSKANRETFNMDDVDGENAVAVDAAGAAVMQAGVDRVAEQKGAERGVEQAGAKKDDTRSWKQKLGTHAWRYLHAFAATYPNDPDAKDAERARWQVAALAQLYPCDECRNHLRSHLASPKLGAVETNSRAALSAWICELHNVINFDLGKPQFDCTLANLDAAHAADAEAGRSEWFYLHTLAAKYPAAPTRADAASARSIVAQLRLAHPFSVSDGDDAAVESRATLSSWLCRVHNAARNAARAPFACDAASLDAVYLRDCGDCSQTDGGQKRMEPSTLFDGWDTLAYAADAQAFVAARAGGGAPEAAGVGRT